VRAIGVSAVFFSILLTGCGSYHASDAVLVSAFESNRALFDELASVSMSGELNCPYAHDPDICVPEGSDRLFAQLKRGTDFRDIEFYVKKGPPRVLWIPVETRGYLSINSSSVGYVYSPALLSPLVGSVWDDFEDRSAYKSISGSWYLFLSN
jgi:hypothetical protein